jgi:Fe-S cluster biosynthesis and repair protein YggX
VIYEVLYLRKAYQNGSRTAIWRKHSTQLHMPKLLNFKNFEFFNDILKKQVSNFLFLKSKAKISQYKWYISIKECLNSIGKEEFQ